MLYADGDALPPQLPTWAGILVALGGVTALVALIAGLTTAFIRLKRYYFGEKQQTVRQQVAQQRADRKNRIDDENRVIQHYLDLYEIERTKNGTIEALHRAEVETMEKLHAAETAELRREIDEVKEDHADCRVRVGRLEEALRSRGWDFPDNPREPATPPTAPVKPPGLTPIYGLKSDKNDPRGDQS